MKYIEDTELALDLALQDVDLTSYIGPAQHKFEVTYIIAGCVGKCEAEGTDHLDIMRQFDLDRSRGDSIHIYKLS